MTFLNQLIPLPGGLSNAVADLARHGTLDPDLNVRELALAILERTEPDQLFPLVAAQLNDADPQVRLLGLQYLRKPAARSFLPRVMALLDDVDPTVVTAADANLRRWTGNDFGIRLSSSVIKWDAQQPQNLEATNLAAITKGVAGWKAWWREHQSEFPASPALTPASVIPPERLPTADFSLPDLDGKTVHLSDYRGKIVLLNFWTTWCMACQTEMPDLIELQRRHPSDLVILGISLDGQPDEHDHGHDGESHPPSNTPEKIQKKVKRLVAARQINYRVALDQRGLVGARFNGQELPTNVLIDAAGLVRRRFIGTRPLAAWEAMLKEI